MTNPYTPVSISGYNSSPPSDDGSETESNRGAWSTIKTKLTDPHNTAIAAINTNVVSAFSNVDLTFTAGTEVVFNESGAAVDFRVEGDADPHLLFLDASADNVGIGTSSPGSKLQVTHSANETTLTLENTSTSSGIEPRLDFYNSSVGGAGHDTGRIRFIGLNDAAADNEFGYIVGDTLAVTAGSESGLLDIGVDVAGLLQSMIKVSGSEGIVINEAGNAVVDFRVESDTNTYALFVDASTSRVGVGTSSPAARIHVESATNPAIRVGESGDTDSYIEIEGTSSSAATIRHAASTGNNALIDFDCVPADGSSSATIRCFRASSTTGGASFQVLSPNTANVVNKLAATASSESAFNDQGADIDFRVESDTSTHALFVDASTNRVGINESAPATLFHITSASGPDVFRVELDDNDAARGPEIELYRDSATSAVNDELGYVSFAGNEESAGSRVEYAEVRSRVIDPSAGASEGAMLLNTRVNNVITAGIQIRPADFFFYDDDGSTVALTIERDKTDANVVIGNGALATTATDGFLYIPSSAGPPTGTPSTHTGRVPLHYDSTNNNLYVYDGSWLSVAVS